MPETSELPALPARDARRILGIGIATLDLINDVDQYPAEDSEVRACAQRRVRGGNCANSLSVLAQAGHACQWVGTLADDPASDLILEDFARHGIRADRAVRIPGATTPTSYIALSRATGSRTIVHYRDLPELDAAAFAAVPLDGLDWVHAEGRNPVETTQMIQRLRRDRPGLPVSLELEKPRPGLDALLDGPSVLLAGRAYAEAAGFAAPEPFLAELSDRTSARICVVAWGEAGACYQIRGEPARRIPASPLERVIDTLGAGDTFNAGVIDGLLVGLTPGDAVRRAVRLAGFKCGRIGLDGLVEDARRAGVL